MQFDKKGYMKGSPNKPPARNEEIPLKKPPIPNNSQVYKDVHNTTVPEIALTSSSFCRTPTARHRKAQSWVLSPSNFSRMSPTSRTRFDFNLLPTNELDVNACEAELERAKKEHKKDVIRQRTASKEEWYRLNNQRRKKQNEELISHENYIASEIVQYRKLSEDRERSRKLSESEFKKNDQKVLVEARERVKSQEREKDKDALKRKNEEFLKRQKELEDKKLAEKHEKEEKRRLLMENLDMQRKMKEEAKLREAREREYERAQYAQTLKNLIAKQAFD